MHKEKDTKQLTSVLNDLIESAKDGEKGFEAAAKNAKELSLRRLFEKTSQQHGDYAAELQDEVARLGVMPETEGTMAASLHRGWMNVKATMSGNDDQTLIDECEREEGNAVMHYREALTAPLPATVREIVERQYEHVRESYDRIRALHHAQHVNA